MGAPLTWRYAAARNASQGASAVRKTKPDLNPNPLEGRRMRTMVWLQSGAAICALVGAVALLATPASADGSVGMTIYKAAHHDISPPVSEMIVSYNKQHAHDVHVGNHLIPLLPGPATQKLPFVKDG